MTHLTRNPQVAAEGLRRLRDGDFSHLTELADQVQEKKGCDRQTAKCVAAMVHSNATMLHLDEESALEIAPVLARWIARVREEAKS